MKKAGKIGNKIATLLEEIGWGLADSFFWKLSVGKTAFKYLSCGFSFGSLIVAAINFYQHRKSFATHIYIGRRECGYCYS